MTDREIMQQALDALEGIHVGNMTPMAEENWNKAIEALRQALAQPEQEPVAWMFEDDEDNGHKTFQNKPPTSEQVAYLVEWKRPAWALLYTTPPRKEWVGLTEGELIDIQNCNRGFWTNAAKIEQLLKDKNT